MNKTMINGMWDHFRTVNGITLRAIEAIPKDKLDSRPCKDMRSPKELVGHMYALMRKIAEGVPKGVQSSSDWRGTRRSRSLRSQGGARSVEVVGQHTAAVTRADK